MKIEIILIGVIALVFLVDFIFKRRKKGLIIPKQKNVFSKKKKIVLIISLLSTMVSSLLIYAYNPFFVFNENNISIIDFIKYDRYYEGDLFNKYQNNELTFVSKKTMEPITGIIYSKYENIGIVINGKANGIFTIYNNARFMDDKYFEKSNYSNGKLDGLSKVWKSRNRKRLIKEANYKNGRLNGSYKEWSYKGQLLKDENYINDKLNGSYRKYYGDKVEVIGNYLNGKKSGSWSVSHLKKEKEIFLNFKNGLFESGENLNELGFYFTPSNGWKEEKKTYQDFIEVIQYAKNTLNKDVTFSHLLIKNDFKIWFYGVNITDLFMN